MKKNNLTQDITDYTYDDIEYNVYSIEDVKEMFLSWEKGLSFKEKFALKMYRMDNCLKFNVNARLRKGKTTKNANIISNALGKAVLPENIIVYRRLAKDENADMQSRKENDVYLCKDFKSTHVETRIE